MNTAEIIKKQREYFCTNETKSLKFRKKQLKLLKKVIVENKDKICKAINEDLGKSEIESYMCEISLVLAEIKYMLKHLKTFSKPKRVNGGIANFPGKSYVIPSPKGVVLIMSPWNYPFMLTIEPLVDAIASGNTAIVKPSNYSSHTSEVIEEIISKTFEPNYIKVVLGGRDVNQDLLTYKFDHIFFTGSKNVGRVVLQNAEKNITPVTLELGGKSPCVVDKTANIELAAKRIVFGKFLNCGQTCVAPDYLLVHENVKEQLVKAIINEIQIQYGENPLQDESYGKMISQKHFQSALEKMGEEKVLYGGKFNVETLKIEPTLIDEPSLESFIMKEEIFAPILPIKKFKTKQEALEIIKRNDTPLAFYCFTSDKDFEKLFLDNVQFGGGCINDTILHLTAPTLPFGGVGESGMGAYHGKRGFQTFSHYKTIVKKGSKFDLFVRYRPYGKLKTRLIKKFF